MTSKNDGSTIAGHHHPSSSKKKVGLGIGVCRKCGSEGGHSSTGGYGNGSDRRPFKKGPWTAEEDALLMEYVKNHGERHWNCVQKTGLMRCGKSCRLRWTNHLRPDLKKGAFSLDEERIVLDLHAKLGNKWSKIAAELPGRTDNEVKNFWNTKIKRRMKVNLLALKFEENHSKGGTFYNQHLQSKNSLNVSGQHDVSSIPSTIFSTHSSISSFLTPTAIPISPSFCKPQKKEEMRSSLISSQNNDPILSFLNNPSYKFQFLTEENERNYDISDFPTPLSDVPSYVIPTNASTTNPIFDGHSHPHSFSLDAGSSNTNFVVGCLTPSNQTNYQQMLPTTPTSRMVTNGYEINDSWISSSTGKNLEVEKSSITEEGKCMIDATLDDEGGEMTTFSRDNNISSARQMDIPTHEISFNGVKRLKNEPSEEFVPMDDDLSSLLYDFSSIGSPPPLYHAIDDVSIAMINNNEEASCVPFTTATTQPLIKSTTEFSFDVNIN